jgi:hypothetical protein
LFQAFVRTGFRAMRVSSASSTPPPPAFAAAAWAVVLLAMLRSDVALAAAASSNDDTGDAPFQNHPASSCALLLDSPTHDSPVFFVCTYISEKKSHSFPRQISLRFGSVSMRSFSLKIFV